MSAHDMRDHFSGGTGMPLGGGTPREPLSQILNRVDSDMAQLAAKRPIVQPNFGGSSISTEPAPDSLRAIDTGLSDITDRLQLLVGEAERVTAALEGDKPRPTCSTSPVVPAPNGAVAELRGRIIVIEGLLNALSIEIVSSKVAVGIG